MKLFSEIYNTYYAITEKILKRRMVSKAELLKIINQNGFSESILFLAPKLTEKDGYGLLQKDGNLYTSILRKEPHIPLTTLEKSWLCSVIMDKKSNLFLDPDQKQQLAELLSVKPLYQKEFLHIFDQYSDGDPFENEQYIQNFRAILSAIHTQALLKISYQSKKGNRITHYFLPTKMEYSAKNDKFRVYVQYNHKETLKNGIINLSQITLVEQTERKSKPLSTLSEQKSVATIKVSNERNAINRFMMEFAELEKDSLFDEDSNECIVTLKYDERNENELVIRLLSFGANVEVLAPDILRIKIKNKIDRQFLMHSKI